MRIHSQAVVAALAGCAACSPGGQPPIELITVPDGFSVEIAAAPPLVERPMIIDTDHLGHLYVAESSGSNDNVQKQLEERPHRILRLEDTNRDGTYDRRTVFADGMMLPEGVLWHDGSVYVSAPPSIWRLTDTDGDGVADEREEWFQGKTLTNCANDLHGPYLGLDGWVYWTKGAFAEQTYERPGREPLVTRAAHVFRRKPGGGPAEPVLTGGMDNPVEVAFTPEGERLLTSTFLIHPQLGRRDGIVHAVYGGVYGKVHGVTDGHPMTGGYLSVMTQMGAAAPVGLARFESSGLGQEYRGRLFATSFNLRKVTAHRLVPDGATFVTEDDDFLVSESRDFHPTDVMEDADGSLLVVDTGGWYKLCCPTSQLAKPDALGAIYRIRKTDQASLSDPLGAGLDWQGLEADGLVALLGDERPAVQRRALTVLARSAPVAELASALSGADSEDVRRNAVWALTRIESSEARAAVRAALSDSSASVRQAALHSVALHRDGRAVDQVAALLSAPEEAVRRVAAEALGRIGDAAAVGPLLRAAATADGEVLAHSLTYALIEIGNPELTRDGLNEQSPRSRRAAMIALDQMHRPSLSVSAVLRLLESPEPLIAETARWIASRHPEWGGPLAGHLRRRLEQASPAESTQLAADLAGFASSSEVQAVLASAVGEGAGGTAQSIALRAMAEASLDVAPEGWSAAIAASLRGKGSLAESLAAARALPESEERSEDLHRALLGLARDQSMGNELRLRALDAAVREGEGLDGDLFDLLASHVLPSVAVGARATAARVLARSALEDGQLLRLGDLLGDAGPMELPQLVSAFGRSESPAVGQRLAEGLSQSKSLANLRADIVDLAGAGFPEAVRARLDELLVGEVEDRVSQAGRIDDLLTSLAGGDVERGQVVFNSTEAACLSCHAIGYQGGQVGPDLTRIGQIRSRRDLLESIVFPSASFVRSYEPVVAVTADGSVNGVPVEETENHLVLAVDADERVRLQRSEIEEVRPGLVSVMPSGLEEQLSRAELADLLAFLEATQWGPPGSRR